MKLKKYIVFLAISLPFFACEKTETIRNTATTIGHSKITFFPTLELKGESFEAVPVGAAYTDPGAAAKEGETEIQYTTAGTVDANTPGVYILRYTAVNKDGFSTEARRTVTIYSTDASAAANDFSGDYARSTNGVICTWIKLAPGVYKVINPGGAATAASFTVIAINPTGTTIKIPEQVSPDETVTFSSDESYSAGPPATFSWKINNPGYGPAIRTFTKL